MQSGAGRGLTSSEVMNDEATLTRVSLRGHVNTVPFVIERSIKRYPMVCMDMGVNNCSRLRTYQLPT